MNIWKAAAYISAIAALAALAYLYSQVRIAGNCWPLGNHPDSLAAQVTALNGEVALLRSRVEALPAVRSRLRAAAEVAESFSTILPKTDEPENLTSLIRNHAENAGVRPNWIKIRSVPMTGTPPASSRKNNLIAWGFSLFVEGGYDQLAEFINSIEQLDQPGKDDGESIFFEITDLNIAGAGLGARHPCTLKLYTYSPLEGR